MADLLATSAKKTLGRGSFSVLLKIALPGGLWVTLPFHQRSKLSLPATSTHTPGKSLALAHSGGWGSEKEPYRKGLEEAFGFFLKQESGENQVCGLSSSPIHAESAQSFPGLAPWTL